MGNPSAEITLVFTDNSEMQSLNSEFREKDYPTDVLSFPSGEDGGYLGDLVISVQKARSQAREYEVRFHQEIVRLIIHGILHLFGYDHEGVPKSEAQKMRRLEKKLYARIQKEWPNRF